MTEAPYIVNVPFGSGTVLSFMTLSCTMLSCGWCVRRGGKIKNILWNRMRKRGLLF